MPSDDGIVVLGIDLDGVCANFYARMREIAAEWFEVDIKMLTESPSYGLEELCMGTLHLRKRPMSLQIFEDSIERPLSGRRRLRTRADFDSKCDRPVTISS